MPPATLPAFSLLQLTSWKYTHLLALLPWLYFLLSPCWVGLLSPPLSWSFSLRMVKEFLAPESDFSSTRPNLSESSRFSPHPYLSGTAPPDWLLPLAVPPLGVLFRILDLTLSFSLFTPHSQGDLICFHGLKLIRTFIYSPELSPELTHSLIHALTHSNRCTPAVNQELLSGTKQNQAPALGAFTVCLRHTRYGETRPLHAGCKPWASMTGGCIPWGWIRKQRCCEHYQIRVYIGIRHYSGVGRSLGGSSPKGGIGRSEESHRTVSLTQACPARRGPKESLWRSLWKAASSTHGGELSWKGRRQVRHARLFPEYCRGPWAFSLAILTPTPVCQVQHSLSNLSATQPNLSLPFLEPFLLPSAFQTVSRLLGKAGRGLWCPSPTLGPLLFLLLWRPPPICAHTPALHMLHRANFSTCSRSHSLPDPRTLFFPSPSFPGQVLLTL